MRNELGGYQADQYNQDYSEEQTATFTAQFNAITSQMASLLQDGVAASSDEVQELVRQHYEFCLQFWTPNNQAYKALALSYILPSPYRDTYEAVSTGLGKFTYDAVVIWADQNLT